MYLDNNLLIPDWEKEFDNLVCGFSLPYYGNQALTRKSYSTGRTLKENRMFLAENLNIDSKTIFSPHQTHSDIVIYVHGNNSGKGCYSLEDAIEGDACFTDKKNNLMLVTWADCIPIILFEDKKSIVAAVHSGWRGTKDNIVTKTVLNMLKIGGSIENIYAAIGPGIRDCCYKVGNDVAEYFNNENYASFIRRDGEDIYLDLQSIIYKELVLAGVKEEKIDSYGKCNSCSKEIDFFSCRKVGKEYFEGQAAFIGFSFD
ncbi:MAG TPA: peptidoglycan editing factor PgeF [Spirochaetota bacterium]|nr:peptidoglycan editing factor PgeF [Spirochaetota bacterium]